MDVLIFEGQKGKMFDIEVGFFDTVLEIKEKIEKYHRIPIPNQTLIFNGQVLEDDRDVEFCEILQNSRIQLIEATEEPPPGDDDEIESSTRVVKMEDTIIPSPSSSNNNNNKIHLNINIRSNQSQLGLEMDSIGRLKERIQQEVVPAKRLQVRVQSNGSGAELQDHGSLRECEVWDRDSEMEGSLMRRSPTTVMGSSSSSSSGAGAGAGASASKKNKKTLLKVMVKPKCGSQKIPMEVNASDSVGELKKELQKLQHRLQFHLPQDGFFFIYDRDVMDEDRSFRWHGVAHGDTIEIFNGTVTG